MSDIDKSFDESYDIIKNARTEIERLQFRKGLHNDVTESVKQTLISLENKLLERRIERPSTMKTLKQYKDKIRRDDDKNKMKKGKHKTQTKAMNKDLG